MAKLVHHFQRRPLNRELMSVLQFFNSDGGGVVLGPREFPSLTVFGKKPSYTFIKGKASEGN